MTKSVAIVGSCVSRDPFDIDPHDRPEILLYSARSSFACAFSGKPFPLTLEQLDPENVMTSNWQKRMVAQDLSRSLSATLKGLPSGTPVIIDFIDERFDLLSLDGEWATYSSDLRATDCHTRVPGIHLVHIDSQERNERWQQGVASCSRICEERQFPLLVNNCLYAMRTIDGAPAGAPKVVEKMNTHLLRMYEFLSKLNVRFIFEDDYEFIAATTHKWKPAPFHYTDSVYRDFNRRLDGLVSRAGPVIDEPIAI